MKKLIPEYSFSEEQLNSISSLAKETGLTEQITRILYARGVDTAQKINRFMHPSEKNFLSPFLMKGMREAVELITRARDEGWTVAVFGDYDADGVCATAIMTTYRNFSRGALSSNRGFSFPETARKKMPSAAAAKR